MFRRLAFVFAGISMFAGMCVQAQEGDIRQEIQQLQRRLADLEKKLEAAEADKAEMRDELKEELKRELDYEYVSQEDLSMFREQVSKISVGGDLKIKFYDYINGDVDGDTETVYTGAGLGGFYLYINGQLTDKLAVDVEPNFSGGSSGATPRLNDSDLDGSNVTKTGLEADFAGFVRAQFTYLLPHGYELTAGLLRPRFTLDYGAQMFYHEEYNASFVSANPFLGVWHDAGAEIYKNFEFETFSLPVYLYILNGDGRSGSLEYADNNEGPSGMIHIEPQFGPFTLLGSYGAGKWDDGNDLDFYRWAAGLMWQYEQFTLRSEFMGSEFEGARADGDDIEANGFYVKLFYQLFPNTRLMANYSLADHNFGGFFGSFGPGANDDSEYETLTLGINYEIAPSSTIMVQYDIADQERDGVNDKEIKYDRLTIGCRITF